VRARSGHSSPEKTGVFQTRRHGSFSNAIRSGSGIQTWARGTRESVSCCSERAPLDQFQNYCILLIVSQFPRHAILSQATTLLAHPCASREGEGSAPLLFGAYPFTSSDVG